MTKPPRRSKYIDQAVVAALRDIKILEAAIVAHDFARRTMENRHLGMGVPMEGSREETMRLQLYRMKSEAQARALMFGNLTMSDELRKQALTAATEFIMRDNAQIMGYLTVENVPPSRYLTSVDVDFRAEIRAAVHEQLGIDPAEDDRSVWGSSEDDEDTDDEEGAT